VVRAEIADGEAGEYFAFIRLGNPFLRRVTAASRIRSKPGLTPDRNRD